MSTPTVSVIIPSYNYARFVREAVDSALAQPYRALEVIVVDDGSKDNTRAVMAVYDGNPRVRYIPQANKGLPGARNTGIRAATGKYIAFLDADDVWEPEKIEQQLDLYEQHSEAAIVATDSYEFFEESGKGQAASGTSFSDTLSAESSIQQTADGRPQTTDFISHPSSLIPHPSRFTSYSLRDLVEFSPFRPSSVMMRKDLCENAGLFDEALKYVEDLDMWARMAAHGPILRLDRKLTGYRNHPAVQSMHLGPHIEYHHRALTKLFTTVPMCQTHPHWRRIAEARLCQYLSWMKYASGNRLGAIREIIASMLYWPFALRDGPNSYQRWHRAKRLLRYALAKPPSAERSQKSEINDSDTSVASAASVVLPKQGIQR